MTRIPTNRASPPFSTLMLMSAPCKKCLKHYTDPESTVGVWKVDKTYIVESMHGHIITQMNTMHVYHKVCSCALKMEPISEYAARKRALGIEPLFYVAMEGPPTPSRRYLGAN